MKNIKIGLLAGLILILLLSGCQKQLPDPEAEPENLQTNESSDVSEQKFVRTESKVVKDKKTKSTITTQESFQLGTFITINLYADGEAPNEDFDRIFNEIERLEDLISKSIETSEVAQINKNAGIAPVPVGEEVYELIKLGLEFSNVSSGGFDISVGPLVDLWGIGTESAHVPEQSEIYETIALINYQDIELDDANRTVFLKKKGMELDLGAIAKGYIADKVKAIITDEGYTSAIINLGGNVLTVGHKPNSEAWNIGVRDPQDEHKIVGSMKLKGNSIVSSGIYERYFFVGDTRYHHILNPKTGYPEENHLQSVSIISEKSATGDGLSTTVFVMGLEEGYKYVESLDQVEALFITDENIVYMTPGLQDVFTLTNASYEVKSMGY